MLTLTLLLACSPDPDATDKDADTASDVTDTASDTAAPEPTDDDADGFASDVDCDDANAAVNPGAAEAPYDGIDNDCDAATMDDDLDGDGFPIETDCDDTDAAVSPAANELAGDDVDNDCVAATTDDDIDGDGVPTAFDCDDGDAGVDEGTRVANVDATTCETNACVVVTQRLQVNSLDDAGLERFRCVRGVTATLDLYGLTSSTLRGFRELRWVEGGLNVERNGRLTSFDGLGQLRVVGSQLLVADNPALESLDGLEALDTIEYGIELRDNASLTSIRGLSAVTTVQADPSAGYLADIEITGNPALASLDGIDNIASMARFVLQGSPLVESLEPLAGASIGTLDVTGTGTRSLAGVDAIGDLTVLRLQDLPALASLAGVPASLTRLDLETLPLVTSLTELSGATGLSSLSLTELPIRDLSGVTLVSSYAGGLTLNALPYVRDLSSASIPSQMRLQIYGLPALESLAGAEALRDSNVTLWDNPLLVDVRALEGLTDLTYLNVQRNASLTSIALPNLRNVDYDVTITDNPVLETVSGLSGVTEVRDLEVSGNARLASLVAFGGLATVRDMTLSDNDALSSMEGFESLRTIDGALTVEGNDALADVLALHGVRTVDDVTFRANPVLPRGSIDALLAEIDAVRGTVTVE